MHLGKRNSQSSNVGPVRRQALAYPRRKTNTTPRVLKIEMRVMVTACRFSSKGFAKLAVRPFGGRAAGRLAMAGSMVLCWRGFFSLTSSSGRPYGTRTRAEGRIFRAVDGRSS